MIYMTLQGRLGNQLYQVFVAVAAAIDTGQSFSFYLKDKAYWDTVFPALKPYLFKGRLKVDYRYDEIDMLYRPFFDDLKQCVGKVCQVNGYFQKIKYFEDNLDDIKRLLQLNDIRAQIHSSLRHLVPVDWERTVCMHFRLGDYVKLHNVYELMPLQYYRDALSLVQHRHPDITTVLYFCEKKDVLTVFAHIAALSKEFPALQFQKAPNGLEDYQEMFLMSHGQHHIIANSTFSFWGAYLQDTQTDRTVCYPSKWFAPTFDKAYDYQYSFPDWWTEVQVM